MNQDLKHKNTITYLHNNLEVGQGYSINGNRYMYAGFMPAVKGAEKSHKFMREGRDLFLSREDLIVLDAFQEMTETVFDRFCQEQGYSINFEFCGYPEKRPVLRFRGEFICSKPTVEEVQKELIFHNAEWTKKINGIKLI